MKSGPESFVFPENLVTEHITPFALYSIAIIVKLFGGCWSLRGKEFSMILRRLSIRVNPVKQYPHSSGPCCAVGFVSFLLEFCDHWICFVVRICQCQSDISPRNCEVQRYRSLDNERIVTDNKSPGVNFLDFRYDYEQ